MSTSLLRDAELDPEAHSGEDQDHMDKDHHDVQGHPSEFEVKEQDRWLPIANVARIMKLALPENAKIAKEAKECMQECVSEFISFITSEASEKCQQEKRKTVNGEDILFAMTSLGFENYAEALKIYLSKYREVEAPEIPGPTLGPFSRTEPRAVVGSERLTSSQTQSARGDNQRPPSADYGAGGPVGGPGEPGPARPIGFSNAEGANHLLNANLDQSGQDASAYSYSSMVGQPHTGAGGESY
ncbi:CCAAT-binding factor complex subunit HapC [Penicillium digitatum PHI26]|uniref:CCAAT-binding factor complex subunit HapC n=2 Tax=Penicillium digitatum TaxID=36651 RepID=K9FNI9_PEND2|nr:CCAAT-binding factor complex subunit HapC [Penicillium digitatum Pd1]EKV11205.1 CCAAT-binding factor complex subunit HapC [Penicillium digitatum PHI26]EKV19980.1 CCAAT-binding factor complex subunit HapC [Penicillium digitatum Pd1]